MLKIGEDTMKKKVLSLFVTIALIMSLFSVRILANEEQPKEIDLVFVLDTTLSMEGKMQGIKNNLK